jgi:NitT/TauT family transport system permease protein
MIVQGQSNISTPTVMAGMLAIGLVGLLIDVALRQMETLVRRARGLA